MGKRKLGRGLDTLIAPRQGGDAADDAADILHLDPSTIEANPQQPRKQFAAEDLRGLRASISRDGILQPVLVRKVGGGYQLVAGERRLRAAQDLALETVPAIAVEVPEDRLLEMALVENIHREDLNPVELAEAYRDLMELKAWTQEELGEHLGIGRASVANACRVLELPRDMQDALARGQITAGHAKVLLSVEDAAEQRGLFERIAEENLSVRSLETVRDLEVSESRKKPGAKGKRKGGGAARKKPYLVSLEEELTEALGLRVRIRERGGKGVVAIDFYSKEDFERLRALLLR